MPACRLPTLTSPRRLWGSLHSAERFGSARAYARVPTEKHQPRLASLVVHVAPVLHISLHPPHLPPLVHVERPFGRAGQLPVQRNGLSQFVQQAFRIAAVISNTLMLHNFFLKRHQAPQTLHGVPVEPSLSSYSYGTRFGLPFAPVGRDGRPFRLGFCSQVICRGVRYSSSGVAF